MNQQISVGKENREISESRIHTAPFVQGEENKFWAKKATEN